MGYEHGRVKKTVYYTQLYMYMLSYDQCTHRMYTSRVISPDSFRVFFWNLFLPLTLPCCSCSFSSSSLPRDAALSSSKAVCWALRRPTSCCSCQRSYEEASTIGDHYRSYLALHKYSQEFAVSWTPNPSCYFGLCQIMFSTVVGSKACIQGYRTSHPSFYLAVAASSKLGVGRTGNEATLEPLSVNEPLVETRHSDLFNLPGLLCDVGLHLGSEGLQTLPLLLILQLLFAQTPLQH